MAMPDIDFASVSDYPKVRVVTVSQLGTRGKSPIASIPEEASMESDVPAQQEVTSILCQVCNMHIEPHSFAMHQNTSGCFKALENKRKIQGTRALALDVKSHREKVQAQRHQSLLEERKIKRDFYIKHFGNSLSTRRRALSAGCIPITAQDNFRVGGTQLGSSFSRSGSSFRVPNSVSDLTKYSRSMRTTSTHTCGNCSTNFLSRTMTPTHAMRPKSAVVPCYHCPNWELVRTGLQGQL